MRIKWANTSQVFSIPEFIFPHPSLITSLMNPVSWPFWILAIPWTSEANTSALSGRLSYSVSFLHPLVGASPSSFLESLRLTKCPAAQPGTSYLQLPSLSLDYDRDGSSFSSNHLLFRHVFLDLPRQSQELPPIRLLETSNIFLFVHLHVAIVFLSH